jgi:hypothetical protein
MSASSAPLPLRRHAPALVTAFIGSAVFLAWRPPSTDLANQTFRVAIFRRAPFAPWNNLWFAGHHTPADYPLTPVLGSVLGAVAVGVLAVLFASWAGSLLVHRLVVSVPGLQRPALASVAFAIGCLASLFGGRTAFVLGSGFGALAILGALRGRWWLAALFGVFASLGNPVAGLFVGVIGCAVLCARSMPWKFGVALVIAPLLPVGVLTVLFPEGGDFPFPLGGAANTLVAVAVVVALGWAHRTVRWLGLGYAGLTLICALFVTPVGGNVARLAAVGAPVAVVLLARLRLQFVGALLVALLALQWAPISLAWTGERAPTEAAFYRPLLDVVAARPGPIRVEVVPVASHTEADVVARAVPIARGWSRQLDRKDNALFYGAHLDPQAYLLWLQNLGVSVVAIADTPLDIAGRREAEVLASPPAYLHEIHRDAQWRIYEVVPTPSLVEGNASLTAMTVDSFTLAEGKQPAEAPETVTVKVHFSPWMHITSGSGCVREAPGGWTSVTITGGPVRVAASITLHGLLHRHGDC